MMKLSYPIAVPDAGVRMMAWCDEFEEAFQQLKHMGYEGVELLVREPKTVNIQLLDRLLDANGLVLSAIGTTPMQIKDGLFLMHEKKSIRTEASDRLDQIIELAAQYQTSAIVGKYRGMTGEGYYTSLPYLEDLLIKACQKALPYGVNLYLEPQNQTNINNLNTISQTLQWIRACECSNLKILADIYHMAFTEPDLCEAIEAMGSALGMIHMSDSERLIPGQGELPLREVRETLKRINFHGFISMEIKQEPDSKIAAQKSMEYFC